ncbi:MAG: hypothetical protein KBT36_01555 [Kurthia sp.]|nr:hypothetical protein [Candidatus Kurthia equi]
MFANVLSFDEKEQYLYTLDLLLIVKLIEEYTDKRIKNNLSISTTVFGQYRSYDDYWFGLEYFIDKSDIGSIQYNNEVAHVHLTSLSQVFNILEDFHEEQRENILDILHAWTAKVSNRNQYNDTALYYVDGPEITIIAEPLDMYSWYTFCKKLIELDSFCKEQLEGKLI